MENKKLISAYSFFENENSNFRNKMDVENLLVDIACQFINYRITYGLTQKELAKKLEITQAMVSKLESGDYNPTVKMLHEIAQKLSWNFSLQFTYKNDDTNCTYSTSDPELSDVYFNNMGLAS